MTPQQSEALRLARDGMYHADSEHDACGVGLIGETSGKPTRRVVDAAIEALSSIWHRGAVDADGKTGDGAGLLLDAYAGLGHVPEETIAATLGVAAAVAMKEEPRGRPDWRRGPSPRSE